MATMAFKKIKIDPNASPLIQGYGSSVTPSLTPSETSDDGSLTMDIIFDELTEDDIPEAACILAKSFTDNNEPLRSHIPYEYQYQFYRYLLSNIECVCYVARDTSKLESNIICVACGFDILFKINSEFMKKMNKISNNGFDLVFRFMSQLNKGLSNFVDKSEYKVNNIFNITAVGVKDSCNNEICTELLQYTIKKVLSKYEYNFITTQCTNINATKACIKAGFECVSELPYKLFEYPRKSGFYPKRKWNNVKGFHKASLLLFRKFDIYYKNNNINNNSNNRLENEVINKIRKCIISNTKKVILANDMIKVASMDGINNLDDFLALMNECLCLSPTYNENNCQKGSLNTVPLSNILIQFFINTRSGLKLVMKPEFNSILAEYLNEYKKYMDSPLSIHSIYDKNNGWITNKNAYNLLKMHEYIIPKNGYKSYNEFFYRQIIPSKRPIDKDVGIITPSDGIVYCVDINNIKSIYNNIVIKNQEYSLDMLLNNNKYYINKFKNGTIIQIFLTPLNYHRFHAPVSGKIIDIKSIGGLYFFKSKYLYKHNIHCNNLFESKKQDPILGSLKHISMFHRRTVVYIKSKRYGVVALIPVGMGEVSSINITTKMNKFVKKGDEIGHFAYGGSTIVVLFENNKLKNTFVKVNQHIKMGQKMAM